MNDETAALVARHAERLAAPFSEKMGFASTYPLHMTADGAVAAVERVRRTTWLLRALATLPGIVLMLAMLPSRNPILILLAVTLAIAAPCLVTERALPSTSAPTAAVELRDALMTALEQLRSGDLDAATAADLTAMEESFVERMQKLEPETLLASGSADAVADDLSYMVSVTAQACALAELERHRLRDLAALEGRTDAVPDLSRALAAAASDAAAVAETRKILGD